MNLNNFKNQQKGLAVDEKGNPVDYFAYQFFAELLPMVLIVALVICIRVYIFSPFLVNGPSMSPTFETSQYLLVEKISKRSHEPQRGDVLVFERMDERTGKKRKLIKRVVGLPGETLALTEGSFVIDGEKLDESWYFQDTTGGNALKEGGELELGPEHYFVSGDNRRVSFDSRAFGPIHESQIIGQPVLRAFQVRPFQVYFDRWPGRN